MSKEMLPRLNKDNLARAIIRKGYTKTVKGETVPDFLAVAMLTFHHPAITKKTSPEYAKKIKNDMSTRMHRASLPAGNPHSLGINRDDLDRMAALLDVTPEYLIGESEYMNAKDQQLAKERKEEEIARYCAGILDDTAADLRQSALYSLIKDYVKGFAIFSVTEDTPVKIDIMLPDSPGTFYTLTPDTFRMIERVCIDTCCSLIRNGSERDRILTTME